MDTRMAFVIALLALLAVPNSVLAAGPKVRGNREVPHDVTKRAEPDPSRKRDDEAPAERELKADGPCKPGKDCLEWGKDYLGRYTCLRENPTCQ
jgi:hypothetical protein